MILYRATWLSPIVVIPKKNRKTGHVVSQEGITMDPDKVQAIMNALVPSTA